MKYAFITNEYVIKVLSCYINLGRIYKDFCYSLQMGGKLLQELVSAFVNYYRVVQQIPLKLKHSIPQKSSLIQKVNSSEQLRKSLKLIRFPKFLLSKVKKTTEGYAERNSQTSQALKKIVTKPSGKGLDQLCHLERRLFKLLSSFHAGKCVLGSQVL